MRHNPEYFATVLRAPSVRVDEILADVDLWPAADRRVGTLSGGQRARVSRPRFFGRLRARGGLDVESCAVREEIAAVGRPGQPDVAEQHARARGQRDCDEQAQQAHQAGEAAAGQHRQLGTALLGDPELLVLDEPTVGLDPVLKRDLWALFRRLAEAGRTLVVSSHVMDEASRCDRLLLLRDGRLVADEPLDALLARTGAADVEQAFLALAEPEGVSA